MWFSWGRNQNGQLGLVITEDAPLPQKVQTFQALSKRIHYGKFVAEAKFQAAPDAYKAAIIGQGMLTNLRRSQCKGTYTFRFHFHFYASITFRIQVLFC
ncbi:hypothetical protein RIF29_25794 [Crotalaria pallida]|uniref:chorismate mutase n=1 Tax=Crotalaria pallida TaxID=3830 RepID=A0AAN9EM08_CROPI